MISLEVNSETLLIFIQFIVKIKTCPRLHSCFFLNYICMQFEPTLLPAIQTRGKVLYFRNSSDEGKFSVKGGTQYGLVQIVKLQILRVSVYIQSLEIFSLSISLLLYILLLSSHFVLLFLRSFHQLRWFFFLPYFSVDFFSLFLVSHSSLFPIWLISTITSSLM